MNLFSFLFLYPFLYMSILVSLFPLPFLYDNAIGRLHGFFPFLTAGYASIDTPHIFGLAVFGTRMQKRQKWYSAHFGVSDFFSPGC